MDARWILFWGSLVSGLATILFGLLATGLASAIVLWGLAGIGFAGAYMPGLKALTDRLDAGDTSRSVTLYTASFSVGVGLSFLVSQVVAEHWGWRAAFLLTGVGPAVMAAVALSLRPVPPPPRAGRAAGFPSGAAQPHGARLHPRLRRALLRAVRHPHLGRRVLGFCRARAGGSAPLDAITVSVAFTVLSLPASILGNEAALKYGRHRAISIVMLCSAVVAAAIGLTAGLSPWLSLALLTCYAFTVPADSGALTSGMSGAAEPRFRGATLALHSTVGFGLSAVGRMGGRRGDRRGRRPGERKRMDGRVHGDGRRDPVRAAGAVVVAAPMKC